METATFSMGNIVSMEPKKVSAGVGLQGPTGGMGARAEGLGLWVGALPSRSQA